MTAAAATTAAATDIQRAVYAPLAEGRSVVGRAGTGTGKTVAFLLPALQRFAAYRPNAADADISIVVLTPTQTLAKQIAVAARVLTGAGFAGAGGARAFAVRSVTGSNGWPDVQGGGPCDLLVATPGVLMGKWRGGLAHHLATDARAAARFAQCRTFVLDEADEMLGSGFRASVAAIFDACRNRDLQVAAFSATLERAGVLTPLAEIAGGTPFVTVDASAAAAGHRDAREDAVAALPSTVAATMVVAPARFLAQTLIAVLAAHGEPPARAEPPAPPTRGGAPPVQPEEFKDFRPEIDADLARGIDALLAAKDGAAEDAHLPEQFRDAVARANKRAETLTPFKAIVFAGSKNYVEFLHAVLDNDPLLSALDAPVFTVHGSNGQSKNDANIRAFRATRRGVMVCTDALKRGMDFGGLTLSVQIGFTQRADFMQRGGRVGRNKALGETVLVVTPQERDAIMRDDCAPAIQRWAQNDRRGREPNCVTDIVAAGGMRDAYACPIPAGRDSQAAAAAEVIRDAAPASACLVHYDTRDVAHRFPGGPKEAKRVVRTWIGALTTHYKGVGMPLDAAADMAASFAAGLRVPMSPGEARAAITAKKGR